MLSNVVFGSERAKHRGLPPAVRGRHQFLSDDVRYVKAHKLGGRAYVISVLDNHSRAILSSAVTCTQDLVSYEF